MWNSLFKEKTFSNSVMTFYLYATGKFSSSARGTGWINDRTCLGYSQAGGSSHHRRPVVTSPARFSPGIDTYHAIVWGIWGGRSLSDSFFGGPAVLFQPGPSRTFRPEFPRSN